jgi:UDP-N-acetyl-2-amino-2-deoxyglucuronate dehydrogenase
MSTQSKTSLNFALIGCGRIGQRHAEHIKNTGKLVAVCDIEISKAEELAKKYDTVPYQHIADLLQAHPDVDVVSVCTPNGLHCEHTRLALNSGFNVLCEKPMALKQSDCGEMIKTAEKNNKRLFVVKQNRFNPPVAAVKNAIEEGKLGAIYSVQLNCFWNRNPEYYQNSWKGTKALDGGTLFTQFSHFIDLLYWMFGDVGNVFALSANFGHQNTIEFEDTGVVAFEFLSGALGTINYTVNSYDKNMEGSLTIFGEKGTVKIGGEYLNVIEYQSIQNFEFKDLPIGNGPNDYGGKYKGSMSNHNLVYQNLHDVFINNHAINTNSYEGMKTVEIIEKIYAASKKYNG